MTGVGIKINNRKETTEIHDLKSSPIFLICRNIMKILWYFKAFFMSSSSVSSVDGITGMMKQHISLCVNFGFT